MLGMAQPRSYHFIVRLGWSVLAWILGAAVSAADDPVLDRVIAHASAHADGAAPCSFDRSSYLGETRELPIGVFDSGIGGLTVLEAILALDAFNNETMAPGPDGRRDFESERFVYFGDHANMPYGNYPSGGKTDYLRERVLKDAVFLLGTRARADGGGEREIRKPPVKAIVIACNTATAYGLEDVRAAIRAWGLRVPVIGIVEAAARGVNERVRSGGNAGAVAVLATSGTCQSMAYPNAIGRAVGLAGKTVPPITQQGSVGLAGAIEGDPGFVCGRGAVQRPVPYRGPSVDNPQAPIIPDRMAVYGFTHDILGDAGRPETVQLNSVTDYVRYDVATLLEEYRKSGGTTPIGTVVLGCTHFPLLRGQIEREFVRLRGLDLSGTRPFHALIGDPLEFLDPAELLAKELFRTLAVARIRIGTGERCIAERDLFFISVPNRRWPGVKLAPDGSLDAEYKYGRDVGQLDVEDTWPIPMRASEMPATSLNLIRTHLPRTWERLGAGVAER